MKGFGERLGFGKPKSQNERAAPERNLPSDVRYALQYRQARIGTAELRDLINNRFEREALYLTLKAHAENPEVQRSLIEELAKLVQPTESGDTPTEQEMRNGIAAIVEHGIEELPAEPEIKGAKLAQLSRQGFDFWQQRHAKAAEKYAVDPDDTFLVGHSMFVGLSEYMSAHAKQGKPLHLLIPAIFTDDSKDICGYRIEGGSVEDLPKDFERDTHAVVIDDVSNTGDTRRSIEAFWSAGGAHELPRFEYLSGDQSKGL